MKSLTKNEVYVLRKIYDNSKPINGRSIAYVHPELLTESSPFCHSSIYPILQSLEKKGVIVILHNFIPYWEKENPQEKMKKIKWSLELNLSANCLNLQKPVTVKEYLDGTI
jgi:hypothetical protein